MRGVLFFAAIAAVAACASAGSSTPNDKPVDAKGPADTSMVTDKQDAPGHPIDAPGPAHDAPAVQHDAHPDSPPPPPDASTDGDVCNANGQCTDSGECCITLGGSIGFCGPGTLIGSTCVPQ